MEIAGPPWKWAGALIVGVALAHGLVGPAGSWSTAVALLATGCAMSRPWSRPDLSSSTLLAALTLLGCTRAWASSDRWPDPIDGVTGVAVEPWRGRADVLLQTGDGTLQARCEQGVLGSGDLVRVEHAAAGRRSAAAPTGAVPRARAFASPPRLEADGLHRLRAGGRTMASSWAERIRQGGLHRCAQHPDAHASGLLSALLFGDLSALPRGMADLFTRTGTRHLLALSGMHVAIVALLIGRPMAATLAATLAWMLQRAGLRARPGPAVPLAVLAALFVPVTGAGAPATRAALALACAALAPHLPDCRRPTGCNLLGLALVVEVILDPWAPTRPGVQLSYAATAALLLIAPRATARILGGNPRPGPVRTTSRNGRHRPILAVSLMNAAIRALALGFSASCVASLATLPIVWSAFGEASWAGTLLTPLSMPAVTLMILGGWAWIAAPWLVPDGLLSLGAHCLVSMLAAADHLPGTPSMLPDRSILLVIPACSTALWFLATGNRVAVRVSLLAFAGLLAPLPWGGAGPVSRLEVHVMDVGNGTSLVVLAPGQRPLVLDAGSRDRSSVARSATGPTLRALDAGSIDVALTHDHADHSRGLPWIARRFDVRRWIGPLPSGGDRMGERGWEGAERCLPTGGSERLNSPGSPLGIRVLRGGPFPGNEGSIMLELSVGSGVDERRVVLSGDAEGHGLAAMLAPGGLRAGPVAALLLPHHGSDSPHLAALLEHLRPREVWISASRAPSRTLAECSRRGIPTRVTGRDGAFSWGITAPGLPD